MCFCVMLQVNCSNYVTGMALAQVDVEQVVYHLGGH